MSTEVRIRTHRAHKKSRNGCLACKERKVKCDEKAPACSTCIRRGAKCRYLWNSSPLAASSSSSSSSSESSPEESTEPEYESCLTPSSVRHPHARLFPHDEPSAGPEISNVFLLSEYLSRTCGSLARIDPHGLRSDILVRVIPSLAVCHTSVSHAIYAISTVSLGVNNTDCLADKLGRWNMVSDSESSEPFMRHAQEHYGRSLTALRKDLASLSVDNADAVIACSLLLVPFEMAYSRVRRRQRLARTIESDLKDSSVVYERVLNLDWMKVVRGLGSLMPSIYARLDWQKSKMRPYFVWENGEDLVTVTDVERLSRNFSLADLDHHPIISHNSGFAMLKKGYLAMKKLHASIAGLNKGWEGRTGSDEERENRKYCLAALDHLQSVIVRIFVTQLSNMPQDLFRTLMLWVAHTEESFFTLLEQEHILAVSVFAHFCAYMTLLEEDWFAGQFGVESLEDILVHIRYKGSVNCSSNCGETSLANETLFSWPAEVYDSLQS